MGEKKIWLYCSLFLNLGVLAFFKYADFLSDTLYGIMGLLGFEVSHTQLNIILPIGISFYTFQSMSYTIDMYRKKYKPYDSILDFSLYIMFFPQLIAGPFSQNKFKFGWMPPHPTLFIKKAVYDKYGFFNVDFGTAADYELIIRLFYKYKVSCTYLPIIITKMRSGGVSNQSFYNHLKAHINDWRTWINNDISSFPWWVVLKPIRKVPQYLGL